MNLSLKQAREIQTRLGASMMNRYGLKIIEADNHGKAFLELTTPAKGLNAAVDSMLENPLLNLSARIDLLRIGVKSGIFSDAVQLSCFIAIMDAFHDESTLAEAA